MPYVILLFATIVVLVLLVREIPEGFEDDNGFHLGSPHDDEENQ